MSLLQFRSALVGGGARPNQFRVNMNFPATVTGSTEAARKSEFLCTAASLPGSNVPAVDVYYRGRRVPLGGERVFEDWTVTVLNDTDFAIRSALERWSNIMNNVENNSGVTNPLLYTAQLEVTQLDRNGNGLRTYNFENAWPTTISPIQLDFNASNQVESFTVTFVYTNWKNIPGSGAGISVGGLVNI